MSPSILNNAPYEAVEILRAAKPGFSPRIALILGQVLVRWPMIWMTKPRSLMRIYPAFR